MIRAEIDGKSKLIKLEASGDPFLAAAELSAIVCNMYAILRKTSVETADTFKEALLLLIAKDGIAWNTYNASDVGRGVCTIASSEPINNEES